MIRLRRSCFIDPARIRLCTIRGVVWACDLYVMVRVDALRTPPKKPADPLPPRAARRIITANRTPGVALHDRKTAVHTRTANARLLNGRGRFVAINEKAAGEWLEHDWLEIRIGDGTAVQFWEKRRGKPCLVGLVMPMYLPYGATLEEVAA